MAASTSPTLRRRRLASELRRLREQARLTCDEVGERLGCTGSRISRIEKGRLGIRPGDVHELLDVYGVTEPLRGQLLQLARDARKRGWWQVYNDVLTDEMKTFVGLETDATSIMNYEAHYIPGLLQTEAYARELFLAWRPSVTTETVEKLTKVRMARQTVLSSADRPTLWAVLDEAVLQRTVGGPGVMREQLHHLLTLSEHGMVTIQIVPFRSGAYHPLGSSFILFEFPDPRDQPVVYMENLAGGLYLEQPAEVAQCIVGFNHLRANALPDHDSAALIAQVAKSL
ncbi:helix-turn-helix transcriptional regulator [Micromonospora sp. WMMD1082]|uniref:helix-turn-helix domain-containing protein n=1 Tax=Micromonospora sp. WMMD1082 TaxID=3016104 RepID=UPI002416E493|nr:helix-turn-helix transcriptional regulator [Micromonospora sp. WMMD1082]MDG4795487.1 helix-turn-helix transcriptional regulator [Micromonospora sp. WMMD1082]